jgi:DNA-binding MarR family transcriptional regulator
MLVMFEREVIDFKELSELVDLKTGTLTPIIQKLEAIDYIFKNKNKDDKRRVNIEITKKGRDLRNKIIEVPLQIAKQLPITKEKYDTLVNELDSLKDMIQKSTSFEEDVE